MNPAYGFVNEYRIMEELNLKRVGEVKKDLQDMLYGMFSNICENDKISAIHCEKREKADICVEINNVKKYISIKFGDKNSVHTEELRNFKKMMLYNNCKWETLEQYLRYHYADGTMDGSGEKRVGAAEYKLMHSEEIEDINRAFNRKKILQEAYRRFLFRGIVPNGNEVDAILHCLSNKRLWAKRDEIIEYLNRKAHIKSSGVHFSLLFVQPFARNLNYNPKYDDRRHYVQIKWFDMYISMSEIKHKREQGEWLDVIA